MHLTYDIAQQQGHETVDLLDGVGVPPGSWPLDPTPLTGWLAGRGDAGRWPADARTLPDVAS